MDKISKLLEETQNLLEGFSSGTLSPVSSYYNSDEEDTEFESSGSIYEFRNILNNSKDDGNDIIKFIENPTSSIPSNAFHICVEERCKDLEVFKALLRFGCDPLEVDSEGRTALTLLLEQKEEDFQGGAFALEVEETNCLLSTFLGEWELRRAATRDVKVFKLIHSKNWKEFFKLLEDENSLKMLCKADPKYAGISPLHEIAAMNEAGCLKKLLSKYSNSIDLNVKSIGTGNTLLHEATHMSSIEMVKLLIESGARCDIKNASGKIAAHLGTEQIQVIFEFRNTKNNSKESISSISSTSGNNPNNNNISGNSTMKKTSASASASESNDSLSREERKLQRIIGFFDQIEKGEEENSETEEQKTRNELSAILQRDGHTGRTILHRYARRNQSERLLKFIKMYERECRENKLFEVIDNSGWTPLHDAASEGSFEAVKIFLFGGKADKIKNLQMDPSIPAAITGDTPLHAAALAGNLEIVELLLNFGANRDAVNIEGKRPVDVTRSKSIRRLLAPETIEEVPNEKVTIKNGTNNTELPVKRGPGRPRKYPRPDDKVIITATTTTTSPPTKHLKQSKSTTSPTTISSIPTRDPVPTSKSIITLPLQEILPYNLNCIILLKIDNDWQILAEHFLNIYNHLAKTNSIDKNISSSSSIFKCASESDKFLIRKLPRVGHLIEILQETLANVDNLMFISKTKAGRLLEKDFNYTLNGPFGYIDPEKLTKPSYCGCPIKLKMKRSKFNDEQHTNINNNNNNILWLNEQFEIPKSPKSFSM